MASLKLPLIIKVTRHLSLIERFFFGGLLVGIILMTLKLDSNVIKISLGGLALTFFMYTYRPVMIQWSENENPGLTALLAFVILPKAVWISTSLLALGILLYLLHTGNNGYRTVLLIGIQIFCIAATLLLFFQVRSVRHLNTLAPILFRAVPMAAVALYVLLK
jgi:hypothetical protein